MILFKCFHVVDFDCQHDIAFLVLPTGPETDPNLIARILCVCGAQARSREHFGCDSLEGAEIEDGGGGGTAGSHFEKRIFMNEFMTGTASKSPIFSAITLALFEDSGWCVVASARQCLAVVPRQGPPALVREV